MGKYRISAIIMNAAGVSVRLDPCGDDDEPREYLLSVDSWHDTGYSEGDILSEDDVESLRCEAEFCRALARGLKILSYSAQSRSALIRKLGGYGFERDVSERAADYIIDSGALNEEKQTESLAEYYVRHKYWGPKRIAAELLCRGYSRSAILKALECIPDESFDENLAKLIRKKPVPKDKSARDKYISSLARMGYSLSDIMKAITGG